MNYDLRRRVVEEADRWIGTPYISGQGMRGLGVDCAQLLIKVYGDAGALTEEVTLAPYKPQLALFRAGENMYRDLVSRILVKVDAKPQPGDVILFAVPYVNHRTQTVTVRTSHGAIVVYNGEIVHACIDRRRVVRERLTDSYLWNHVDSIWAPKVC